MLNRTIPPTYSTIDRISVTKAQRHDLENGAEFYTIQAGSQEVTRLEFIFRAGMYYQPETLIASMTNTMLECGTKSYGANEFSEAIDFYGSFLELHADQDFAAVTVYSLNKYLKETLKYVEEMIRFPSFPETEFQIHLNVKRQKHAINSQKVSVLVRRKFTEALFGEKHPYGINVSDKDFDRIHIKEIGDFFNRFYTSSNGCIIAAGNLPADIYDIMNGFFGKQKWGEELKKTADFPFDPEKNRKIFIEREDAVQSALRVGRILFNKRHPDYFHFQVLNTVLGGYFGSRLMANIREDKGYTYGVGSGLNNLVHGGYFFISAEVGAEVTAAALKEIYHEMKRLREELVPDEELETVRNYILGQFLRSVDGPFALADKFKGLWEFGLDYDYYDRYFDAVKNVKPERLRELANQYLTEESMTECVAGKM